MAVFAGAYGSRRSFLVNLSKFHEFHVGTRGHHRVEPL